MRRELRWCACAGSVPGSPNLKIPDADRVIEGDRGGESTTSDVSPLYIATKVARKERMRRVSRPSVVLPGEGPTRFYRCLSVGYVCGCLRESESEGALLQVRRSLPPDERLPGGTKLSLMCGFRPLGKPCPGGGKVFFSTPATEKR